MEAFDDLQEETDVSDIATLSVDAEKLLYTLEQVIVFVAHTLHNG